MSAEPRNNTRPDGTGISTGGSPSNPNRSSLATTDASCSRTPPLVIVEQHQQVAQDPQPLALPQPRMPGQPLRLEPVGEIRADRQQQRPLLRRPRLAEAGQRAGQPLNEGIKAVVDQVPHLQRRDHQQILGRLQRLDLQQPLDEVRVRAGRIGLQRRR